LSEGDRRREDTKGTILENPLSTQRIIDKEEETSWSPGPGTQGEEMPSPIHSPEQGRETPTRGRDLGKKDLQLERTLKG